MDPPQSRASPEREPARIGTTAGAAIYACRFLADGTLCIVSASPGIEDILRYLAYYDANRLEQAILQAHRHAQTLTIFYVDLDDFKIVNDTLGHHAGDTLLQQVSLRLRQALRTEDTVGRLGGDELLILMSGLSSDADSAHVAEKTLTSLSHAFHVAGQEVNVSASSGIRVFPRDAEDAEMLVKHADAALRVAKEQGRNTFRFFSRELDPTSN